MWRGCDLSEVNVYGKVEGSLQLGTTEIDGVHLTLSDANPCRFTLEIPFSTAEKSYAGGLFCQTTAPSKRALMAGTSVQGGFYAYRTGDVPLSINIVSPADGESFPRGRVSVDFVAEATNWDHIVWTSSLDGTIGTGLRVSSSSLPFGDNEITATASNAEGETATDSVHITITNDPPTVEIVSPPNAGPYCTGELITFEATVTDLNNNLPDDAVAWRVAGSGVFSTGKMVTHSFSTAGDHTVVVRATDDQGAFDEASTNITIEECTNSPPVVTITEPSQDIDIDDLDYVYDGFDDEKGMWYTNVTLEGEATDPEDGVLTGDALHWTTNRSDLQPAALGTGQTISVRLYSDTCTGVWHEISLSATDSDGNVRTVVRRIFIWALC